ncbi:MAG: putative quinol monooxygenase [Methylophilaceae bacterium]|jgi:quinol monooxygenase YgiN
MSKVALYVRLEAKPEKAKELEQFLKSAVFLLKDEPETITWYALKFTETTFGIFDSFNHEDGRKAHLAGKVAEALFDKADELLAEKPVVIPVELLATKFGADAETSNSGTKKYNLRFVDGL